MGMPARPQETPQRMLARVRSAYERRKNIEEQWRRNVLWLNGEMKDGVLDLESCDVNMFWSTLHSMIPSIYFQDPEVVVKPKQPSGVRKAPILEAAISHYFNELDMTGIVESLITDAFCFSWAVIKVGYLTHDEEVHVKIDNKTGAIVEIIDKSKPVQITDFRQERRLQAIGDRPMVGRVSPFAFIYDPRAIFCDDADWVAEEIVRHVDDLRSDPIFENRSKIMPNVQPAPGPFVGPGRVQPFQYSEDFAADIAAGPYSTDRPFDDPDADGLVKYYEITHLPTKRIYFVAEKHDFWLRNDPIPYESKGFLYKQLFLGVRTPDNPNPIAPLTVWQAQQRELNKLRAHQMDHVKRATPLWLVDVSRADTETQAALKSGTSMRVIPINGSVEGIVKELPGTPMNPELHQAIADCKSDIKEISGRGDNQRGFTSQNVTASEQKIVQDNVSINVNWMRSQVGKVVRWTARKIKDLLQQFADKPTMIKLSGRADFEWKSFTADDIQGDYDVDLVPDTQIPFDRAEKRKEAENRFNLLMPVAMQTGIVDPVELTREFLEASDVVNIHKLMPAPDMGQPPTDPADEEFLLSRGEMPEVSPNDNHQEHIQVHQGGAGQDRTPQAQFRRERHIAEHQKALQMAAAQQAQALGAPALPGGPPSGVPPMPGGPGGPPPGPGLQMGMGRAPTQPGQPMAPRLMGQKAPEMTQMLRVNHRGAN